MQQSATEGAAARRVHIITDSASDLAAGEFPDVSVVPLTISFGNDSFEDGVNLTHRQFYEKLVESDELPRTSQATPFAFTQVLAEKLGQPGEGGTDEAVIITLSAKLSGTYDSALAAAEPWGARVHVVDSTNVTVGEKALVAYAIRLVEQGMCASEVAAELNRVKGRIRLVALLDTLEYLQKGGRISKTVAIAGGMLSIKPVISIQDGLVVMLGKARGSKKGNNLLIQQVQTPAALISRCRSSWVTRAWATSLSKSTLKTAALYGRKALTKCAIPPLAAPSARTWARAPSRWRSSLGGNWAASCALR